MVLFSAQNVEKGMNVSKTIPWGKFKKNNLGNPKLGENKITIVLNL